jgi:hypothetical protein
MKPEIQSNKRAHFNTDASILNIEWLQKFHFDLKYIVPVHNKYIAFSGGSSGHGLFDIKHQCVKWFYEEMFDWTGPALVYNDYLIFPKESSVFIHDVETGKIVKQIKSLGGHSSNIVAPLIVDNLLIYFRDDSLYPIDLTELKRKEKISFTGKISSEKWFPVKQEVAYYLNRFWIITKKRNKWFLEGISLTDDSVLYTLPQDVYISTSAVVYANTLCFMATNGHFYGVDLKNGKFSLDINILEQYQIEPSSLRVSKPILHNQQCVFHLSLTNKYDKIVYIDLEYETISPHSIHLENARLPADMADVISGIRAVYATSAWHDVLKLEQGKIVAHIKVPQNEFYHLSENCLLLNEKFYSAFSYEHTDANGDETYLGGIICIC